MAISTQPSIHASISRAKAVPNCLVVRVPVKFTELGKSHSIVGARAAFGCFLVGSAIEGYFSLKVATHRITALM